jgi:hypothetical protein
MPMPSGTALLGSGLGDGGLQPQPEAISLGVALAQPAVILPEAPYTIWNLVGLVVCSLLLILVGMMVYDLLRNMWGWQGVHPINSALMDSVLSWFEK